MAEKKMMGCKKSMMKGKMMDDGKKGMGSMKGGMKGSNMMTTMQENKFSAPKKKK